MSIIEDSNIQTDNLNTEKLIIVDTRVREKDIFLNSVKNNVSAIILDFKNDTYDSILAKIKNNMINNTLESIALVSHGQYNTNFSFLQKEDSPKLKNISLEDPIFNSWNMFLDFLIKLKDLTSIKSLDLLGCAIVSYDEWKLILNYLETNSGLNIRASIDNTGNLVVGGNWILETDNIDAKELYFTDEILNFTALLPAPEIYNEGINIITTTFDDDNEIGIEVSDYDSYQWYKYKNLTGDGNYLNLDNYNTASGYIDDSNSWLYFRDDSSINGKINFYYCKLMYDNRIANSIPIYVIESYRLLKDTKKFGETIFILDTENTYYNLSTDSLVSIVSGITNIQWQSSENNIDWVPISGQNTSSYTPDINFINKYIRYSCIFNNTDNVTAVSNSTRIIPNITTEARSILKTSNSSDSLFSIIVNGVTSYQWKSSLNNSTYTDISGANSSTYDASSQSIALTFYRCMLNGYLTSGVRFLLITDLLLPNTINVGTTIIGISTLITARYFQWQSSPDNNNNSWTNISGATLRNYTPASNLLNQYIKLNFSVYLNGSYTPIISTNVTQVVQPSPNIISQPSNIIKSLNTSNTSFDISSNGATVYQWQSSTNNTTFTDISGATTSTYNASSQSIAFTYYRCLLNGYYPSNSVYLLLTYLLLETDTISGTTLNTITGATAITWYSSNDNTNWNPISGATSTSYTTNSNNKYIRYICTYDNNSITSNSTIIPVTILTPPTSIIKISSNNNSNSTFSITPSYTSTYQWRSYTDNTTFTDISGETSSTYTPTNITNYITYYKCKLNDSVLSNSIYLLLTGLLLPTITISGITLNTITGATAITWQSSNDNTNWNPISGATSTSYTTNSNNKYIRYICNYDNNSITSNSTIILNNNNFDVNINNNQFIFSQNNNNIINPSIQLDYHIKYTLTLKYQPTLNTLLRFYNSNNNEYTQSNTPSGMIKYFNITNIEITDVINNISQIKKIEFTNKILYNNNPYIITNNSTNPITNDYLSLINYKCNNFIGNKILFPTLPIYPYSSETKVDNEELFEMKINGENNTSINFISDISEQRNVIGLKNATQNYVELYQNKSYSMTVNIGTMNNNSYSDIFKVFIDYNGNSNFTDIGETAYSTSISGPNIYTFNLTTPLNALITGNLIRIRIIVLKINESFDISSNNTYEYGSTYDFSARIVPSYKNILDDYGISTTIVNSVTLVENAELKTPLYDNFNSIDPSIKSTVIHNLIEGLFENNNINSFFTDKTLIGLNNNNGSDKIKVYKCTDENLLIDATEIIDYSVYINLSRNNDSFVINIGANKIGITRKDLNTYIIYDFSDSTEIEYTIGSEISIYGINIIFGGAYIYTKNSNENIPCLVSDTKVLTPNGYIKISELKINDLIITSENKIVPIKDIFITIVNGSNKTYPYIIEKGSISKMFPPIRSLLSRNSIIKYKNNRPKKLLLSKTPVIKYKNYPPERTLLSAGHLIKYENYWIHPQISRKFPQDKSYEKITYYHIETPNYKTDNLIINGGLIVESYTGNNTEFKKIRKDRMLLNKSEQNIKIKNISKVHNNNTKSKQITTNRLIMNKSKQNMKIKNISKLQNTNTEYNQNTNIEYNQNINIEYNQNNNTEYNQMTKNRLIINKSKQNIKFKNIYKLRNFRYIKKIIIS